MGSSALSMALPSSTVTDLSREPLVLKLKDILRIYRIGRTIAFRDLSRGTFRPMPFARNPYRWRRIDVEEDLCRRDREGVPLRGKQGRRKRVS